MELLSDDANAVPVIPEEPLSEYFAQTIASTVEKEVAEPQIISVAHDSAKINGDERGSAVHSFLNGVVFAQLPDGMVTPGNSAKVIATIENCLPAVL